MDDADLVQWLTMNQITIYQAKLILDNIFLAVLWRWNF